MFPYLGKFVLVKNKIAFIEMNVNIFQLKYEIYKKQTNISEGRMCKLWCTSVSLPTIKQRAKELRTMEGRMKA